MTRGALIAFEGIDGTGKTTQCDLLVRALADQGREVLRWSFPVPSGATGPVLGEFLAGDHPHLRGTRASHLLFACNMWEAAKPIREAVERGVWVVVDRYCLSTVAYSVAQGLDAAWCGAAVQGLPLPDQVVLLDVAGCDVKPHMAQRLAGRPPQFLETDSLVMRRAAREFRRQLQERDAVHWPLYCAGRDPDDIHADVLRRVTSPIFLQRLASTRMWSV